MILRIYHVIQFKSLSLLSLFSVSLSEEMAVARFGLLIEFFSFPLTSSTAFADVICNQMNAMAIVLLIPSFHLAATAAAFERQIQIADGYPVPTA